MLLKEIKAILGGDISDKNTKMPGTTFGLSTLACAVGSILKEKSGTVCEGCYAARLENFRPSVMKGWKNRTEAVHRACEKTATMKLWVNAFVQRLEKLSPTHHRWHDSGDLQSSRHLSMILSVAGMLPGMKFWLPTKERAILKRARKALGDFPANICIRESAAMVGERLNIDTPNSMVIVSQDVDKWIGEGVWICPAPHQGNACQDCRACWDNSVKTVAYIKH